MNLLKFPIVDQFFLPNSLPAPARTDGFAKAKGYRWIRNPLQSLTANHNTATRA